MNLQLNSFIEKNEKINDVEVYNMLGSSGREVPNQYEVIIYTEKNNYRCFYSYNSLIVVYKNNKLYRIGTDYAYSRTTGKYRNQFTKLNLVELDRIIKEKFIYNSVLEQYVLKEV